MNIAFKTIEFSSSYGVKNAIERELKRVEKIFKPETFFNVCIKKDRLKGEDYFKCDILIKNDKNFVRGYGENTNVIDSINKAVDSLIRKARKIKSIKIKKRYEFNKMDFNSIYNDYNDEKTDFDDDTFGKVVKEKNIVLDMMTADEAIIQMELISHNFYMFLDDEGYSCVLYKKNNNEYGLIRSVE